jgi:chloramphenicol O-acetyltransferase
MLEHVLIISLNKEIVGREQKTSVCLSFCHCRNVKKEKKTYKIIVMENDYNPTYTTFYENYFQNIPNQAQKENESNVQNIFTNSKVKHF